MKKIILTALAVTILASLISITLAEEFTSSEEVQIVSLDKSIVNETEQSLNEEVSGFRIFWEKVGLWFTLNKQKKVEKELRLASMLLNRARVQAKNKNDAALNKTLEEHNKIIERVRGRVEKLNKENISSEKLTGLDRAIQVHELKIQRFNEMLSKENISEKQKENIEKMLGNSQKSIEVLTQLKELREEREQIKKEIRENISNKEKRELLEKRREKNSTSKR